MASLDTAQSSYSKEYYRCNFTVADQSARDYTFSLLAVKSVITSWLAVATRMRVATINYVGVAV